MTPRVVWPAPGYPHTVSGDMRDVRVLAAHEGERDDALRDWAAGWVLRSRPAARSIPLAPCGISRPDLPPEISALAALPEHGKLQYAEILLRAEQPLAAPARRSAVFDLVSPRQIERSRSVAWFAHGDDLRLAFASDVHVAALWDQVADAVHRYAPDLVPALAHPGTRLRRFVDDMNQRAGAGELDAVVFGGDLVDHVYTRQRTDVTGTFGETNISQFLTAIDRLEVPSFVIPGNHDYRLYPWRPRAYGLHAAHIPKPRLRSLLEQAGWWDAWPLRWNDLEAVATDERPLSPLHHHLWHLCPSTNYDVQIGSTRLVFLDSGRDVVPRWRTVDRSRYPLLIRSLPGSWIDPDSEGLSDRQLAFLDGALSRAAGAAVFCHAPLLASHAGPIPALLSQLDVERFASDLRFEHWLARRRARCGVLFHNAAALVRLLKRAPAPLTWFGGHVHRRGGYSLDKQSGAVRDLAPPPAGGADQVDCVQVPSLGLHGARPQDHPEYLLVTLRRGRLTAHRYCELATP